MEDTQKSFDELKKFSKTLHEAEMFILGSILKMRRGGGGQRLGRGFGIDTHSQENKSN